LSSLARRASLVRKRSEATQYKKREVFIPDRIYQMQSDWYSAVLQRYGLPLDSRHLYTKSDWEFFAAAVTSKKTRTEILTAVARWVNETSTGTSPLGPPFLVVMSID
jgi:Domain of unknown function (DUF1793).